MTLHLSIRQQAFVSAIIAGKSQIEAYKAAGYQGGKRAQKQSANQSKAVAEGSMRSKAAKVAKTAAVAHALARARAVAAAKLGLTVEDLVAQLIETREIALSIDPPQCSASAACTMGIGKLLGLVVDKKQVGIVHHKPGLSAKAVELSAEEWQEQFTPRLERPTEEKITP